MGSVRLGASWPDRASAWASTPERWWRQFGRAMRCWAGSVRLGVARQVVAGLGKATLGPSFGKPHGGDSGLSRPGWSALARRDLLWHCNARSGDGEIHRRRFDGQARQGGVWRAKQSLGNAWQGRVRCGSVRAWAAGWEITRRQFRLVLVRQCCVRLARHAAVVLGVARQGIPRARDRETYHGQFDNTHEHPTRPSRNRGQGRYPRRATCQ